MGALAFRRAEARDVEQAVPLIHSSGPAAFDHAFARAGITAQAFLAHAFVDGRGMFGHPRHVVGEHEGRVVAAGTGFGGEHNLGNTLTAARQILRCYGLRALPVMIAGLRLERIVRPPPRDVFYLAHLGVAPGQRGAGFGTQLIEHLLALGRASGFARAGLDVATTNPRAQALYERMGFVVEVERVSTIPGIANHRVMTRAL